MSTFHENLSVVRRPIENARGLANEHYTHQTLFREENTALLMNQWAGIGVGSDVPHNGDTIPLEFCGIPLLIIRDHTGVVRVFQNVCRHRGMILINQPGNIEGVIRCQYHSWCYATDGRLVSTPHVGGPGDNTHHAIDKSKLGLIEVPTYIWNDVIFVNISESAVPFETHHHELLERWSEFKGPVYHGGHDSRFQLQLKANWKLVVENYCESYHLPWIHPNLNTYSRLEDHYHIESPGKFSGQGTHVYRQIRDEDGSVFPDFPNLSEKWTTAGEYITFFPNVMVGVQRDHLFVILLNPVDVNCTREDIHLYYATDDTSETLRKKNTQQWRSVFLEDVSAVEGMQLGRSAPGFDGGRFSPAMDGPTHLFHDWVAQQLQTHHTSIDTP